jgi:hypothetical protein
MATELVAQLRLVRPKAKYEFAKDHFLMIGKVMREAADEIERLERELADMTSDYLRVHNAFCDLKYPETARDDVPSRTDKLRAALADTGVKVTVLGADDVPAEPSIRKAGDECPTCRARLGTSQNQVRCANCGWLGTYTPNRG